MFKIIKKHKSSILAAVAEIVIVFVGISISISIDDWREESANRETEKVYLEELYLELSDDLAGLSEKLNWINEVRFRVTKVLTAMHYPDSVFVTDNEIKIAIGKAFILIDFVSKDHTFNDLTNTGNIKLITNPETRKNIYSYYASVKRISNLEEINNKATTDILTNDLMRIFPLRQLFDYNYRYKGIENLTVLDLSFTRNPDSDKYIRLENSLLLRLSLLNFEFRNYSQTVETGYFLRNLIGNKLNLPTEQKFVEEFKEKNISAEKLLLSYQEDYKYFTLLETPINEFAYEILESHPKKALELFLLNTIYYPMSNNVWDSAGDGYLKNGNKKKAMEMYAKAIELNPDFEETRIKFLNLKRELK
jgi:hypothetical protein